MAGARGGGQRRGGPEGTRFLRRCSRDGGRGPGQGSGPEEEPWVQPSASPSAGLGPVPTSLLDGGSEGSASCGDIQMLIAKLGKVMCGLLPSDLGPGPSYL